MQQLIDHPSDVAQHISCATVNMAEERIIKHPSHPEHFLSFFKYKSQFTCDDCGEEGVGNGYECAVCNFELHMSCAMNNTTEKKVIQHPIDPGHCLSYVRYPHGFTCNECGQKGCGKGYGCVACDFDLHKSCATIEMAEERAIMHPLHPAHCLSFFKYKRGFICNACGEEGRGNSYGCAVCKFDLHISCATATDTDTDTDTETVTQPLSCLGHRLSYARYTTAFTCNLCGEGGRKNGYGCVACDFDLHISCATLNMAGQRPIQHPSHPRHRLSYVRYPRGFFCDSCRQDMHGNGYRCSVCDFDLHLRCAKPPPNDNRKSIPAPRQSEKGGRDYKGDDTTIRGTFANLALCDRD